MSSSHSSASAAEAQTTLRLQHADRLPTWLYLGLPLVAAVALFIAWRVSPQFYEAYIGSEIGILEGAQVLIPLVSVAWCLRILALAEVRDDRLVFTWIVLALLGSVYMAGEKACWGPDRKRGVWGKRRVGRGDGVGGRRVKHNIKQKKT